MKVSKAGLDALQITSAVEENPPRFSTLLQSLSSTITTSWAQRLLWDVETSRDGPTDTRNSTCDQLIVIFGEPVQSRASVLHPACPPSCSEDAGEAHGSNPSCVLRKLLSRFQELRR